MLVNLENVKLPLLCTHTCIHIGLTSYNALTYKIKKILSKFFQSDIIQAENLSNYLHYLSY